jgi:hypothetical protein
MKTIAELKESSPFYSQRPDGEVAYLYWNKKFKDQPMGVFADKAGLSRDGFNDMLKFAHDKGHEPTGSTFAEDYIPPGSEARAVFEGQTLGWGGEAISAAETAAKKLTGDDRPIGDIYSQQLAREDALLKQYKKAAPLKAAGYEIAGGVASPAILMKGPQALANAGKFVRGAAGGAATGATYGAGTAEEGERLEGAVKEGLVGAATGGVAQKLFDRTKSKSLVETMRNPTVGNLHTAKSEAYKVLDQSGEVFGVNDIQRVYDDAIRAGTEFDVMPEDKQARAALRLLENRLGTTQTLSQMDKLKSSLWKRWESGVAAEKPAIRAMITAVDDRIAAREGASEVVKAARSANNQFKKAETLDKAFQKARVVIEAGTTNIEKIPKFKKAIASIVTDPKQARWFSTEDQEAMLRFIEDDHAGVVMGRIAKLAPKSGFEWMMHLTAGYMATPVTALTASSLAAKKAMSGSGEEAAQRLISDIGGVPRPEPRINLGPGAGIVTGGLMNQ